MTLNDTPAAANAQHAPPDSKPTDIVALPVAPPKHVALFVPSLRGGGAERVMSILARGLSERGVQVDLILAEATGPYLADIPPSVRIVDLRRRRVLTSLPGLVRYFRQERPDALLSTQAHANLVVLWAKMLSRVSARVVIRQASMLRLGIARVPSRKEAAISKMLARACSQADSVVVSSDAMAEEFRGSMPVSAEQIRIINNPVPSHLIQEKASEPVTHPWFQSGEPALVLAVGRLSAEKGFGNLIDAFAKVRGACAARLMILGEGEMRASLQAQIDAYGLHSDVSLPGFIRNPYKYMRRATVFVLPSRWEGFPNALVEAMACGAPVIATNCPGGTTEILEDGKWGAVVEVGDAAALANAITDAIEARDHPDVRHRARAFTVDAAVEQYMKVLIGTT